MKGKVIWISIVCVLVFLTIRLFRNHGHGVRDEKVWYINELDFEFSGILDSADRPGQILFHVTSGQINRSKESELKKKLKFNGILELLLYRADGKLDLFIQDPHQFNPGDSLYLNSERGLVQFYRNGEMISEHALVRSLRGRPF